MTDSPLLLFVLLGALVALPLVLRRVRNTAPDAVRVLGRTALHKSAVVAVVAVGDRRLLVGAGERGVQLLAELEPTAAASPGADGEEPALAASSPDAMITTTASFITSTGPSPRMDACAGPRTDSDASVSDVLAGLGLPTGTPIAGPGIGLVDRLRSMTVRTPAQGRPLRVHLRR